MFNLAFFVGFTPPPNRIFGGWGHLHDFGAEGGLVVVGRVERSVRLPEYILSRLG